MINNIPLRENNFNVPRRYTPVLWCRKGQGITVTGSGVSQWDDQSGEDNHLLQATDTNRPALQSDGSILFDGVDNYLQTAFFNLDQPTTVYILFKQVSWTSTDRIFDGNVLNAGTVYQDTTSPNLSLYAGSVGGTVATSSLGEYGVLSTIFNGASSLIQHNNNSPSTGNAGANNMDRFTLGAAANISLFSNIQVQEAIIFNVAHNAEQRAAIIRYLARVGGLTI